MLCKEGYLLKNWSGIWYINTWLSGSPINFTSTQLKGNPIPHKLRAIFKVRSEVGRRVMMTRNCGREHATVTGGLEISVQSPTFVKLWPTSTDSLLNYIWDKKWRASTSIRGKKKVVESFRSGLAFFMARPM